MRNEAVAALLVATVILSAATGYYSGVARQRTVTSTSTTTLTRSVLIGSDCATPVSQPSSSNETNIYILSVPSEAAICVTYTYEGNGNVTYGTEFYSQGQSCSFAQCVGLNGSVSPTIVSYNGLTNVTVTYRISASPGLAQGTYWLVVGYGEFEALVVGPPPTNINISADHPPPFSVTSSPTPIPRTLVVGVTDITVMHVPCAVHSAVEGCGGFGRASG
jgi:hypothetical protein